MTSDPGQTNFDPAAETAARQAADAERVEACIDDPKQHAWVSNSAHGDPGDCWLCGQPIERHLIYADALAAARAEGYAAGVAEGRESVAQALREHWLHAIHCDEGAKTDTPLCACSRVQLPARPSIGQAVQVWVDHVVNAATNATEATPAYVPPTAAETPIGPYPPSSTYSMWADNPTCQHGFALGECPTCNVAPPATESA